MPKYEIAYDDFNFDPPPTIKIDISHNTTPAGAYLHTEKTITLDGTIVETGVIALRSGIILAEKLNLSAGKPSRPLVITASGDSNKLFFLPEFSGAIVKSFSVSPRDHRTTVVDYNIVFSIISYNSGFNDLTEGAPIVASATDNYSVELLDDKKHITATGSIIPFIKVTRNIGAVGLETKGDYSAIYQARTWVHERQKKSSIGNINELKNWVFYNHDRKIDEDTINGSYNITDTFLACTGRLNHIHQYTVEGSSNDFNNTIKVQGTVQGLEPANTGFDIYDYRKDLVVVSGTEPDRYSGKAYDNAYSAYTGLAFSGIWYIAVQHHSSLIGDYYYGSYPLQHIPIGISEGFNIKQASISYEYTYDNRRNTLLSGALVENLSINNEYSIPTKRYKHSIPGRLGGPIIVYNSGTGVNTKTISYEAFLPPNTGLWGYAYSQKIKDEVYDIVSKPITGMLGPSPRSGYIQSYETNHNLGYNTITATLKFINITCNNN